jgi:hypothetical protein
MAANPIPNFDDVPGAALPDAATATQVLVVPTQEIIWQNHTLFAINITVEPVNGAYPFSVNSFPVPGMRNQTVGTYTSVVLAGTPPNQYTFTRTGAAPMGNGKVVVSGNEPA